MTDKTFTYRKPLTPHQRRVLEEIRRHARVRQPGASERTIGSRGAVDRLIAKGYVMVTHVEYGPRGGAQRFLAPFEVAG